jgi:multidrug efflux system outer membrane protein
MRRGLVAVGAAGVIAGVVGGVVGSAGCSSMAPGYERPASPVPANLPVGNAVSGGGGGGGGSSADLPWRDLIQEPRLRQIVEQAFAQNRSLRKVVLSVESARAQYRIQRAAALPAVDAAASVTRARAIVGPGNATATSTLYAAQVGLVSWEIDLFGRIKSLSEARLQEYLSTVEVANATRVSLVAETATAYLTLAADHGRLAIAEDTMASSRRTMELTEQLVGGGTSNRADFWQVATVYQQARADVAALTTAIAQDRNALELLAGGPIAPTLLPEAMPAALDWFADIPVGLSSAVLLNRPDVLAAEHDLEGANANIGAARALLFPSLTLTASGGAASLALGALFTGPAAVYALAPSLALPLFRGGANRANLEFTRTQKLMFVASYELAIQSAFREVADALAARATLAEQLDAQTALVDASTRSFELAQARYQAGIESFLSTLVSQRALYAARNSRLATQLAALRNRVILYRVLGGGLK